MEDIKKLLEKVVGEFFEKSENSRFLKSCYTKAMVGFQETISKMEEILGVEFYKGADRPLYSLETFREYMVSKFLVELQNAYDHGGSWFDVSLPTEKDRQDKWYVRLKEIRDEDLSEEKVCSHKAFVYACAYRRSLKDGMPYGIEEKIEEFIEKEKDADKVVDAINRIFFNDDYHRELKRDFYTKKVHGYWTGE